MLQAVLLYMVVIFPPHHGLQTLRVADRHGLTLSLKTMPNLDLVFDFRLTSKESLPPICSKRVFGLSVETVGHMISVLAALTMYWLVGTTLIFWYLIQRFTLILAGKC